MDSQIEGYLLQLTSITQDLPGLASGLTDAQFNWRPAPGRWSIGQCIEHLNITTERYLPVLRKAMDEGRSAGRLAPGPFAIGLVERWFVGSMEPPAKRRFKTPKAFVAPPDLPMGPTVDRWRRLHAEFAECIRSSEGLDLRRIKVRSQFAPLSFSLAATVALLLAHERRHTWQARQVRKEPGFPAS